MPGDAIRRDGITVTQAELDRLRRGHRNERDVKAPPCGRRGGTEARFEPALADLPLFGTAQVGGQLQILRAESRTCQCTPKLPTPRLSNRRNASLIRRLCLSPVP